MELEGENSALITLSLRFTTEATAWNEAPVRFSSIFRGGSGVGGRGGGRVPREDESGESCSNTRGGSEPAEGK